MTAPPPVDPIVLVLRHVPHEDLGTFAARLQDQKIPFHYLDVQDPRAPYPRLKDVSGVVVMGGPMGVYEKKNHPFLKREIVFLKKALRAGKPVLGVCLGAQLIAHALGARVYPHAVKEIGWYPLGRTPAGARDPLFRRFPAATTVFQWHGDTFDVPSGARLLATSPLCRAQAFVWGRGVYGLQFHVEVDGPLVRRWLKQPGVSRELKVPQAQSRREIERGTKRHAERLARLSSHLMGTWVTFLGSTKSAASRRKT